MKKKDHVKNLLELGCGQGRGTLFFELKGTNVTALDSSSITIKGIIAFYLLKRLLPLNAGY
jgi:hypothetical protein